VEEERQGNRKKGKGIGTTGVVAKRDKAREEKKPANK